MCAAEQVRGEIGATRRAIAQNYIRTIEKKMTELASGADERSTATPPLQYACRYAARAIT